MNMRIIYHTYICNEKSLNIVSGQLYDIEMSEIMNESKLDITITYDNTIDRTLITRTHEIINSFPEKYKSNITVIEKGKNQFEYLGINQLYQLACIDPTCIFIYMHTKGASHKSKAKNRSFENIFLTRTLLWNWRDNYKIFSNNSDINYMGLFPTIRQFVWFNFFWVRGSYVTSCEVPREVPKTRYYYEAWLSTGKSGKHIQGYSLYKNRVFLFDKANTSREMKRYTIAKVTYGSHTNRVEVTDEFIKKMSDNIKFKIDDSLDQSHPNSNKNVAKNLTITFYSGFNIVMTENSNFDSAVFFANIIKRNTSNQS
jgi:hypothetical protein